MLLENGPCLAAYNFGSISCFHQKTLYNFKNETIDFRSESRNVKTSKKAIDVSFEYSSEFEGKTRKTRF